MKWRRGVSLAGFYSTATEAKLRAEALQTYIKEQNEKGKNLIGGIITNEKIDCKGHWRVNQQAEYKFDKNDLTKWGFFDNLI